MAVRARLGKAGSCWVGQLREGPVRLGLAGHGGSRFGSYGWAVLGTARQGWAVGVSSGEARCGMVWPGSYGWAWLVGVVLVWVGLGMVWQLWRGESR